MEKFDLGALPENMKFARAVCGLTQKALAERAGMSEAAVVTYETARTVPTLESAVHIAESLGVTVNDLVDPDYVQSRRKLLSARA